MFVVCFFVVMKVEFEGLCEVLKFGEYFSNFVMFYRNFDILMLILEIISKT